MTKLVQPCMTSRTQLRRLRLLHGAVPHDASLFIVTSASVPSTPQRATISSSACPSFDRRPFPPTRNRSFSASAAPLHRSFAPSEIVDLRSDTLTAPTRSMLERALSAKTGDDVFGEDPTVLELEKHMADLFEKEKGLFLPTGTMANLVAILAHCHNRASEIIIGSSSHIALYEGGNAANLGGVHTRQIPENETDATLSLNDIRDAHRHDDDDHYAETSLICLENTQNSMGGVALPPSYVHSVGTLARDELGVRLHVDGARIFNSAVTQDVSVAELCGGADSVSVCLSKGLGAPLGSVLVGESEFIRLAKRARKRCGGGMRQAGVVAAMGLHAVQHHVERLREDHKRANRLATGLHRIGFILPRDGKVDTNIVYFGVPEKAIVSKDDLSQNLLCNYGVRVDGGYSKGGDLFRAVVHKDIDDEGIDRALEALKKVCFG